MRRVFNQTFNTYRQSQRTFSTEQINLKRSILKPSVRSLVVIVLAAFGFNTILRGLDSENDNLSAANFRSVHAEEDYSKNNGRLLIACTIADDKPTVVEELKTVMFPGSAIVEAALSIADCDECAETVPPPTPSFQHCVHSEAESMVDQKDYSCADDKKEHKFLVRFGRYLSTNDFLE